MLCCAVLCRAVLCACHLFYCSTVRDYKLCLHPPSAHTHLHPWRPQHELPFNTPQTVARHRWEACAVLHSFARPGLQVQDPTLRSIAERHGRSPAEVAVAWAVQRGTSCLPKSTQEAHLR